MLHSTLQCIHRFNTYLMNACHVRGPLLGAGDTVVSKADKNPYLFGTSILVGRDGQPAHKDMLIG